MTDKELEAMIADIEESGLMQAPSNLKADIFDRIEREEKAAVIRRRNKKAGFIIYTLEVMAVSAAAIALIMLHPLKGSALFVQKEDSGWNYIKEEISEPLNDWTGKIVSFGGFMDRGSEEDPGEVER